jgi:hypothetical protein
VTRVLSLASVLAISIVTSSCSRRNSGTEVDMQTTVTPTPAAVGSATVDVHISDHSHHPLAASRVGIEGTMTHPGMAPSLATAREVEAGHYRAMLDLTMAGDWVIVVNATLANGQHVERTFPLPGVRAR